MDYRNFILSDIVIVDVDGNIIDGKWKVLVDLLDYLYIYKYREDINSIIYIYFIYLSCFVILNEFIECVSIIFVNEVGGLVLVVKFLLLIFKKMGKCVIEVIGDKRVCFLVNYGVIVVGLFVGYVFIVVVMLEDLVKVYYLVKLIGILVLLFDEEI